MGRSKPRTNKRPPPKPNRRANGSTGGSAPQQPAATSPTSAGGVQQQAHSQSIHFDPATSLFPPPSTLDPSDPMFPSAFQSWSTSALNQLSQLGQLPRLTPSQLSAIAGAAAGIGDAGLLSAAAAGGAGNGGQGPCIDLPQSLAALFEAKLTLDREKAKLMRMQKELRGFRDGNGGGPAPAGSAAPPMVTAKGKEVAVTTAVADDDDLAECTCGRNGHTHEYPGSAHSGSDDYYYYDTEDECCECCSHDHSYIECDHEPGECDCEEYEELDEPHHHHHHHHHHHDGEVDSDADEYEYADGHGHSHGHGHVHGHSCTHGHGHGHGHGHDAHAHEYEHGHGHGHGHDAAHTQAHPHYPPPHSLDERGGFEALVLGPDGRAANLTPEQAMALFGDPSATGGLVRGRVPSPAYLNSPEARAIIARHHAKQQEIQAAKQQLTAGAEGPEGGEARSGPGAAGEAGRRPEQNGNGHAQPAGEQPRRRLADDPERMDEACRELFNWIKAVVWTIEQAAIVAGRRGGAPLRPQRRSPGDALAPEPI